MEQQAREARKVEDSGRTSLRLVIGGHCTVNARMLPAV